MPVYVLYGSNVLTQYPSGAGRTLSPRPKRSHSIWRSSTLCSRTRTCSPKCRRAGRRQALKANRAASQPHAHPAPIKAPVSCFLFLFSFVLSTDVFLTEHHAVLGTYCIVMLPTYHATLLAPIRSFHFSSRGSAHAAMPHF